jgi:hypothetical protein
MTTFTEKAHGPEFILSEANGQRSRANGTVASGEVLEAGEVVMLNGAGKLVAWTGDLPTDGGVDEAEGIMLYPVDATDGDVAAAYLARDAEVNLNLLVYPENSDGSQETQNVITSLGYKNIIARS